MKVLILNSPLFKEYYDETSEDYLPPIGLGYILSNLKNHNIELKFYDAVFYNTSFHELLIKLESHSPDYIATNIFSTNYFIVKDLIESYKGPSKFIIGGLATRTLYKKIIHWKTQNHIDVVIGDGENIISDVITNQVKQKPLIQNQSRRIFLVDKSSQYYNTNISNDKLDRSFFPEEPSLNHYNQKETSIVTSRGCIYDCAFCGAARSQNKDLDIRYRSEESVVDELKQIQNEFPEVGSIRILDDLFLKSKNNIEQAIQIFNRFDFQWRSMAHVRTFLNIEQSLINDLKASGCQELFIGIESGSEKVLKMINKNFTVQNIYDSLANIFKANINVKGYFIYGFPNETVQDLEMTYKLATELKRISETYQTSFRTSVFQFRPYHGTQLYCNLLKEYSEEELFNTAPNKGLTEKIGRMQFNFHSKNFAKVDSETIHDYICRTNNLNVPGKLSTE